ncbi:hypothetical protein [Gulbenkiania mobilis]|uniref:Uncharacterized protein n=1 Tax=Gulbenkiania mobilis TaxID=397457 RepID=A0ABY2CU04_GULMO|nr:hypothetical protein EV669_1091 [Gulbenkiania mobilis]
MKLDLSRLNVPGVTVCQNAGREHNANAETLTAQGFAADVPVVPVVPVKNGKVRNDARTPSAPPGVSKVTTPAPSLPADLLARANLICQLEQWPEADRLEWLDILRRQIDRDGVPVPELVACLDAHLAVHHGVTPEAIRVAA